MRTILLVDDDPLRAFVRMSVLQRRFADVRRVSDAAQTLCLIEDPSFAVNLALVISDHGLSGLNVSDFVGELHTRMPGLPVLILGNSGDTSADSDGVRFLSKSISNDEMLIAASQLLAQRAQMIA
jgi:DNA-binding NtrC family response regulator